MTFEEQLKRLEEIVAKLESGECAFSQAIALFDEGKEIAKSCSETLDQSKGKITELISELDTMIEREMK